MRNDPENCSFYRSSSNQLPREQPIGDSYPIGNAEASTLLQPLVSIDTGIRAIRRSL
jgi:hypothetical protein